MPDTQHSKNLMDAVLEERDRLTKIKHSIREDINAPAFFFYKAEMERLLELSDEAIAGRLEVVDTLVLYEQLKNFDA